MAAADAKQDDGWIRECAEDEQALVEAR